MFLQQNSRLPMWASLLSKDPSSPFKANVSSKLTVLYDFSVAMSFEQSQHYQLSGGVSVRTRENVIKLCHSIEVHCKCNPFALPSPLKSLVSSALVPHDAKDDIQHFNDFINERLLFTSTISVWDPMKKLKLKNFSNWAVKTKV